jgi:hypothetical protein
MQEFITWLFIGAGCFILYWFFGLIQIANHRVRVGFWGTTWLFSSAIIFVGVGVAVRQSENLPDNAIAVLFAMSLVMIVFGFGAIWVERNKKGFALLHSRGVLSMGVGIMVGLSLLISPVLPNTVFVIPTPTSIAEALQGKTGRVSGDVLVIADSQSVVTPTMGIPTVTRQPLPTETPTPTRRAYIPPTATMTPDVPPAPAECDGFVNSNLNVRQEANLDADIVAIVPMGQTLKLYGVNEEKTWWFTEFEGVRGWVYGELLTVDAVCFTELP